MNHKKDEKSFIFNAPTIGLVFGNLGGDKDKDGGGSGLIAPLGIDIGLLLGWTVGFGRSFGLSFTPGIVVGRMGFVVLAVSLHWKQTFGIGLVLPVIPVW